MLWPPDGLQTLLTRIIMQHVSATFRKKSIDKSAEADQSTKQVVLFKPEQAAPAPTNDVSRNAEPFAGLTPELKGFSIINQGHLTLHYHSYNEASSSTSQPAVVPLKQGRDKNEDEQYSEALSSLMSIDLSPQDLPNPQARPKRQRMEKPEEPETEMVEPEAKKPRKKVKQEDEEPAQKASKKKSRSCKNCGCQFNPNQNKDSEQPCRYHPGMSTTAGHSTSHWKTRIAPFNFREYSTNDSLFISRTFQTLPVRSETERKEWRG